MFLILFKALRPALLLITLSVTLTAAAQWSLFESDFDDAQKTWKEIEARLPPYPKPENLVPFEAGAATPHRFFVDAPSISVGEDGVVRYTLVVRSAGGAANVSFEGIRCETREQKYYAIGQANGAWSRARNPQWRRIEYKEINRHHGVLYGDFFCNGKSPVRSAESAVDALKYGPAEPR
ncbi:MAG: hypothetical protein A3G24_21010 [Betaproteobacteria bacterium RIFCSPLOWO2_12_FULL_62_13]|nr:MAG: hypothetical protein A3G24_21010 [Betaproteobacteria bacterium RIFCSPLOWO2_12_FULL_62_13]